MIAARVGGVRDVAAARELHGDPIAAHLVLGRVVQSGRSSRIEHGKAARVAHVIRGQLHGGAEMIVVQQTSRWQTAQSCGGRNCGA